MKFNTPTEAARAAKKQTKETGINHIVDIIDYINLDSGVKVPIWTIMPERDKEK